jgi:3-oxoacyl-[acyl-carrier-protein] synthase II
MAATKMALEDAKPDLTDEERDTTGVFIGVGRGGLENLERCTLVLDKRGPVRSAHFIPSLIGNMAAGLVRSRLARPSYAHTMPALPAHALGEAYR